MFKIGVFVIKLFLHIDIMSHHGLLRLTCILTICPLLPLSPLNKQIHKVWEATTFGLWKWIHLREHAIEQNALRHRCWFRWQCFDRQLTVPA